MTSLNNLLKVAFAVALTSATGVVNAQISLGSGMDVSQLSILQDLSPEDREALLDTLIDEADGGRQKALSFPDLLQREGLEQEEELESVQIFNSEGRPILDASGEPVRLTEKTLDELQTESPDDWLENGPFFQQEIRLEPFGYKLFDGVPTTFAPATDIPVPNEYRMGPGDTIDVQLFGKENRQYSLVVNRDGSINFPGIGPVNVMGQSFHDLKQAILDRVAEQLIGTSASVTMGALRSITVLVVGDAHKPGSYTVSGLSTITNALLLSGGVSEVGSLRNIELKRANKVVVTFDLYDLLLEGNASSDLRLESGDVIFIPPVGATVGVGGFVRRPAIYELKSETTAEQVVALAGGLRPDAYPEGARVERIDNDWQRSFINFSLGTESGDAIPVRDGDVLLVPPVLKEFKDGVRLLGHATRPGVYQWKAGMRLADLLPDMQKLRPQADLNYVLIRRETHPNKRIKVISANLEAAIADSDAVENILLAPRDEVSVFKLEGKALEEDDPEAIRRDRVDYLLEELMRQSGTKTPLERLTVSGQVRAPGYFPYEAGMTVSDLIRAGGGFTQSADPLVAELTRYEIINQNYRSSRVIAVDLMAAMAGDSEADIAVIPSDFLAIRRVQNWNSQMTVNLVGQLSYPGTYTIRPGDTLHSVIARAGGLTDQAFPEGAIFLREALRKREQQQLNTLRQRLQGDLASLGFNVAGSIEGSSVGDARSAGSSLLSALNATKATGRLVIDLPALIANSDNVEINVLLQDGDTLAVPRQTQAITVIGEVRFPTSHLYSSRLNRDDYIESSGGVTPNGSDKNIYIVHANGAVVATNSRWFRGANKMQTGDTIVVPLDTDKGFRLQAWAGMTSIVYNLAIAVAAINGLSN